MTRSLLVCALALATLPVAAQNQPDLEGGRVVALSSDSANPGDSLGVSITASNTGDADAPSFSAAVYFSTDRFVSADDSFRVRVQLPAIPAQRTAGRGVRIAVPNVPRGGYFVLVALDDPNTITEVNEDNNVNIGRFTVSPALDGPDLLVSTGTVEEDTVEPGGRLSAEYVVANNGRSDVGDYEVGYYLSPINARPSEWIFLERETLGGVEAGENEDESEQVTVPASTPPGEYGFIVVLDDGNAVPEADETNNTLGLKLVTVTGATAGEGAPDTSALDLSVSPNPSGASVRLVYVLAAAGPVRLAIYDALGREVAVVTAGEQTAGAHVEVLDTSRLAPGVYVARILSGGETAAQLVTVTR